MLTFQLKALVPTAELPSSEMSFDCGQRGLGAPGCPTFRNFRIGPGGGQEALRQDYVERRYPVIQRLNASGLERTRTIIPPLQRNVYLHKRDLQHPFSLSQELSRSSHAGRPSPLSYSSRYEPSTSPSVLFPPTLVLKGRNAFLAENCKLSRPRVKHPTYNLLTVKDNHKRQSYPDPMVGAPRSFLHRVSELSTLEGETVRQEKRLKLKKARKPPS